MGGGDRSYSGNIDLNARPRVYNQDGSVSTELSFSREDNGKEILVPQIVNGKLLSEEEAWKHYKRTGEHLGKFDSVKEANAYAEMIHNRPDSSPDPSRGVLLNRPSVIVPETGAGKYWYVDPRASQQNQLLEVLGRLGVIPQEQQSRADSGQISF